MDDPSLENITIASQRYIKQRIFIYPTNWKFLKNKKNKKISG